MSSLRATFQNEVLPKQVTNLENNILNDGDLKIYFRHIKNYHLKQTQSVVPLSNAKNVSRLPDGEEIFKKKLFGLNCPYCNKFLTSKHSLSDHIRVRHEFINFSERFLCDICGKGKLFECIRWKRQ